MNEAFVKLLKILDLEQIEVNLFRGTSPDESWQRVFGGQVIGQALVAATRTVEEFQSHSLHGYFLRPGDPKVPIIYNVDRSRDGKSFATRSIVAIQHGRPIFNMSVSFQRDEAGLEHQFDMPDVPAPEDLPTESEMRAKIAPLLPEKFRKYFTRDRAIEIRAVEQTDWVNPKKREPIQHFWIKTKGDMPDDQNINKCVLAYASDMTLLDTCIAPHGVTFLDERLQVASLDHAMWFHRPFKADQWMLFSQDTPSANGAKGLNRGSLYTREGILIASVAQEGLIRMHEKE
ncbi:MAG: acyl-CoA thioesterase II [Alphaproteobacteria bacterium]|nr:acyl-CoA thioesterase II [Rhodospirillales bacterium]MCW9045772.1 acyl-CoA thioesterase II [Alphaproteobacteria bacterium]